MRSYNLRHLVAQVGVLTVFSGVCSGVFTPSALPIVALVLVLIGLASGVLVTLLVRDWQRYVDAQDTLWRWDEGESPYDKK